MVNQRMKNEIEPQEQQMQEMADPSMEYSETENEQLQEGEIQATPEEQAALEQAYDLAMQMVHGQGQSGDKIAQIVLNAQDVTEGIGQAVATVIIGVEKKTGGLPDYIKLALAQEVLAELAGLAVEAGALSEDEVSDEWIDSAVSQAYSNYLSMKESMGELNQQELEASVSEAEKSMGISVRNQQANQPKPQQKPSGLLGQV